MTLEFPDEGGHVGFVSGPFPGHLDWLPRRAAGLLQERARYPADWPPLDLAHRSTPADRRVWDNACVSSLSVLAMSHVPPEIFKAYDIRGIVGKTLTPDIAELIGRAIGSQARALDQTPGLHRPRRPPVRARAVRGARPRPAGRRAST